MTTRIRIGAALAFAALALGFASAPAQAEYPDKKIIFLVGFPPGGAIDLGARHIADAVSAQTKQPVIIENKPGAGGIVAGDTVAHARPDGYTLFYSPLDTLASASYLYKTVSFDPMNDLVPIASTLELPFVLQVNPKKPITSVAELSAFLKTKKGDATFAAPNAMAQIASDLYKSLAGVGAFKVPYKSIQTAQTDLMGGDIDFLFIASSLAIGPSRDGKLRSLAVTSHKRSAGMPELPTMVEAGVPGYELSTWSALWAPKGTPPEAIKKLNGIINAFLATDASRAYLRDKLVADTFISTPAQLADMLKQQHARWGELVKLANIEPQ
jgi:tripartite-type tricarboxylate transporter receptor subunit TctC